jgi:glycosyltransferase involved in cell wall biosynthesis
MRILVVSSYPPRHCGIGAYARDQVAELRAEGYEVAVLSPPDGDGDVRAEFLGGEAFRVAARMARDVDRVIVHFQPALYYEPRRALSKVRTSVALWALAGHPNVEILVHEADSPIRWRPDYVILRFGFRRAPRLLFHTDAERGAFERSYGRARDAALVPHRVAPAGGDVSREEARSRLGLPEADGSVLVCAGFLQPSKGFDRAVQAFGVLGLGDGTAALYVVGSVRHDTPENQAYAEELRVQCGSIPGVHLEERFLTDAEFDLWVRAADRLVLPYRESWSSGVLARAQALGTPAIVTAVGGLGEQAGPQDLVVEDDEQLVEALRAITRSASPAAAASTEGTER